MFVLVCCAWACGSSAPHLLRLHSINPRAVQARDVLTLTGDGFVAGAEGRLTLEGTLHRPGRPPQAVRSELPVQGISSTQAEVRISRELVERWCTTDDGAVHATFRGRSNLAFRPRTLGAPPLVGQLDDVVLEVYPELGAPSDTLAARVEALQSELGWGLVEAADGVLVEQVEPGMRAYQAGLREGDHVLEFAGVTVTTTQDLAPYAGQREAKLKVRHVKGGDSHELTLDVAGVYPQTAAAWKWAWGLVGVFALLLVTARSPLGYLLAWLESQAAVRPGPARSSAPRLRGPRQRPRRSMPRSFSAFLGVSALFAALALRHSPLELDLLWVFLGGVVLWCLAGLLSGGWGARWSLWRGLWAVARQLPVVFVTAGCLAVTLLERGNVRVADLARPDGGAAAVQLVVSLPQAIAGLGLLACVLILALRQDVRRERDSVRARLAMAVARWLEDAHLLILGGLFIVLFLGGWGTAPSAGAAIPPALASLLLFEGKLVAGYVLLVWLRRRTVRLPHQTANAAILRYLLPMSVVTLILVPVWSAPVWPGWLRDVTMLTVAAVALVWILLALGRWSFVRYKKQPLNAINPWL